MRYLAFVLITLCLSLFLANAPVLESNTQITVAHNSWLYETSLIRAPTLVIEMGGGVTWGVFGRFVAVQVLNSEGVDLFIPRVFDTLTLKSSPIYYTYAENKWLSTAVSWAHDHGYVNVVLYGYSAGAMIAEDYALHHSGRISSLILKACSWCWGRWANLTTLMLEPLKELPSYNVPSNVHLFVFNLDHAEIANVRLPICNCDEDGAEFF